MRRTIGFFSFAAVVLLALPAMARAIDFDGISAYPANPIADDERTDAWFIYTLSPGGSADDALIVENDTGKNRIFELYPADSTPSTGGGFALKQKIEPMTAIGRWTSLEKTSIALAAHEKISIPFRVTLPADITPGLYAGGIIVAENADRKGQDGININTRVGVRMYVTVVPPNAARGVLPETWRMVLGAAALMLTAAFALKISWSRKNITWHKKIFRK